MECMSLEYMSLETVADEHEGNVLYVHKRY